MRLPGSPVPVAVGRVVLRRLPLAGPTTLGVNGEVVSMVKTTGLDGGEMPLTLRAVTVTTCGPSASATVGVHVNEPPAVAVARQTTAPSMMTEIVVPGSPVPVKVGVESELTLSAAGAMSTGVPGNLSVTVKVLVGDRAEVLPAASLARASTVWVPAASVSDGVQAQSPFASALVTQAGAPSTFAVTRAPGAAVPLSLGVGPEVPLSAGAVTTGTRGTAVSTRKALVLERAGLPVMFAVAR